jgi:hypothetical protein
MPDTDLRITREVIIAADPPGVAILVPRSGTVSGRAGHLEAGAIAAPACARAGIDARTLRRWKTADGLVRGDRRPDADRPMPKHALSVAEWARIIEVANDAVTTERVTPFSVHDADAASTLIQHMLQHAMLARGARKIEVIDHCSNLRRHRTRLTIAHRHRPSVHRQPAAALGDGAR